MKDNIRSIEDGYSFISGLIEHIKIFIKTLESLEIARDHLMLLKVIWILNIQLKKLIE